MHGKAPDFGKSSASGAIERLAAVKQIEGIDVMALARQTSGKGKLDDLLDACAACWTAQRIADEVAISLPGAANVDLSVNGWHMRMWA